MRTSSLEVESEIEFGVKHVGYFHALENPSKNSVIYCGLFFTLRMFDEILFFVSDRTSMILP